MMGLNDLNHQYLTTLATAELGNKESIRQVTFLKARSMKTH